MSETKKIWSYTCPDDFRARMDGVLSMRAKGSADVWIEVVDWLNKHDVQVPDHLVNQMKEVKR